MRYFTHRRNNRNCQWFSRSAHSRPPELIKNSGKVETTGIFFTWELCYKHRSSWFSFRFCLTFSSRFGSWSVPFHWKSTVLGRWHFLSSSCFPSFLSFVCFLDCNERTLAWRAATLLWGCAPSCVGCSRDPWLLLQVSESEQLIMPWLRMFLVPVHRYALFSFILIFRACLNLFFCRLLCC